MPDTGHFTIISGPADADWDTCPRCLGRGHYFGISTIFKIACDRCRGAGILGSAPYRYPEHNDGFEGGSDA